MSISTFVKIILTCTLFYSCSVSASIEDQQRQFDKIHKKWLYKGYRKISTESIRVIAQAVNLSTQNEETINRAEIHAILGFIWSLGLDANFAIADARLALSRSTTLKDRYIAETALTLALYNKGWAELARQHSNNIASNAEYINFAQKYEKHQVMANLIVGCLAIREGNLQVVEDTFAKVSEETQKPWLSTLAKSSTLILNGSILDAPGHIKALLKDPSLTEYERTKLEEISTLARTEINELKKQNEFSQLVNGLMFETLKNNASDSYKQTIAKLNDYISSVDL